MWFSRHFQFSVCISALFVLVSGCTVLKVEEAGRAPATPNGAPSVEPPLHIEWIYNAGAGFGMDAPLIVGETVIVGTRQGEIHGIDVASGKRRGIKSFGDVVEATPVMHGGTLLVPVGWGRRSLVAFDLARGAMLWKRKGAPIAAGLLLLEDAFVAVDTEAQVRRHNVRDGAVAWEQMLGDNIAVHTRPVMSQGSILLADDTGRIVALNPEDGSVDWVTHLYSPVYASLATDPEALYVPTTRGRLFALNAADGDELWHVTLADSTVRFSAPSVDSGLLVAGASDGLLRAYDAKSGALRWAFRSPDAIIAKPLITRSSVYVGSMGKMLYAVDRATGALQWQEELRGRVKSAIAGSEEYLIVLAEPRYVYLFTSGPDDVSS